MASEALRLVRRKDPFCAPKGTQRAGPGESRKKPGAPTEARARPQPAQGLRGATSSPLLLPSQAGAGREHKRLQLPSGHRPTPNSWPRPWGTGAEASCERQTARGGRRWPRAGDPGRRAWEGEAQREGGQEFLRLPGLQERPKTRVSKNRQRPARGGEEQGTARPALLGSGPRPPLTRAEVWRKARGAEGDGAAGSRTAGERRRPGPPREEPEHTRETRDCFRPLGLPRLRTPRRSRAPPH